MVLQSSGAISFANIQTEFGGTNPIGYNEYFANASSGYTSGVSGIPNTGSSISINMFYGKAKGGGGAPNPVASTLPGVSGGVGSTDLEVARGLYAYNSTRQVGSYTFDYRTATDLGSSNDISYPEVIIQANPGDTITLIARLKTSNTYTENAEFWVWLGGSWSMFTSQSAYFAGDRDFTTSYTIPSSTPEGNYGLAIASSYNTLQSSTYRSWRSYSLHVWISAPNPVASTLPGVSGGVGSTTNEVARGLYAYNSTRQVGSYTFDYRTATDLDSSNDISYPTVIIQAKPGDTITLIARLKTSSTYTEHAEFWVWLGGSWSMFTSELAVFAGDRDFTTSYTIPSSTPAGNYGLAIASSYGSLQDPYYRSWRSYSLHVWT